MNRSTFFRSYPSLEINGIYTGPTDLGYAESALDAMHQCTASVDPT
jgi:hypothetical protein